MTLRFFQILIKACVLSALLPCCSGSETDEIVDFVSTDITTAETSFDQSEQVDLYTVELLEEVSVEVDTTPGPPCTIPAASGMLITPGQTPWPSFSAGDFLKVNSLTGIIYEPASEQVPNSVWGLGAWWISPGNDPWSEYPYWGDEYIDPNHQFKDDHLRWKCGYSYVVELPAGYDPAMDYPVIVFLHGSVVFDGAIMSWYHGKLRTQFHHPAGDPYIYVAPIKLEIDWDAKKLQDVVEDVKAHLSVNYQRIYLTGLSMGGRGTFIVAAKLKDTFAAIMPLSPHHEPYSYIPLAPDLIQQPIKLMHGELDETSPFSMASEMASALQQAGATIEFHSTWTPYLEVGHWGWEHIYMNPEHMTWLLSWENDTSK